MAVKTYEEILAEKLKEADEEAKIRSAKSTELINNQLNNTNVIIDSSLENSLDVVDKTTSKTVSDIESEINKLPATYQSAYDINEVQKRINEKQIEEQMANMGLTNSGLNTTQQTALSVAKMNADNALTQKKYAQINSFKQQIADVKAAADLEKQQLETSANLQKQQAAASAEAEIASNNLSIYDTYRSNAQSAAASIYEAQQEAVDENESEDQQIDFTGTTQSQAISYMLAYGVPGGVAQAVMPSIEWKEKKDSGEIGDWSQYDTYKEYLDAYIQYALEEAKKSKWGPIDEFWEKILDKS